MSGVIESAAGVDVVHDKNVGDEQVKRIYDSGGCAGLEPCARQNTESDNPDSAMDTADKADDKVDNPQHDPYAYIANNGFTSEKYKIEVRGLPKYYGLGELRRLLNDKLGLQTNKIKATGQRSHWVYVCFRCEEDRKKGIEVLDSYKWKGSVLTAKVASPAPDPLAKRRNEETTGGNEPKRMKVKTTEQEEEALKNSATPFWNVPYEEQLKKKNKEVECLLRRLGITLGNTNPGLKQWVEKQKAVHDGLPCQLLNIRALPQHSDHYRNKCEFSIGRNEVTGEKTVGFRVGTYASGSLSIAPVDHLKNFSQQMLQPVHVFEEFLRKSELEVFSPETLSGHWRQLTVRVGVNTGQVMLIVGFHPQQLDKEKLCKIKEELKEFFSAGPGSTLNATSVYFQFLRRKERGEGSLKPELLLGEPFIEEVLCGLTFKISPLSFFQVNTKCAEVLMETVKELIGGCYKTTLLDVCCGTGTIGLCLAKDYAQVLGVEVIEAAVKDARENAKKNNISNSEFFCGKADDILSSVVMRAAGNQVVAVVDPPRAGLHQKAVTLLRRTKKLEKLVFLSCDSKSAFKNFVELGRAPSKTLAGLPFVPVKAVAVDMFPHTPHFELVIYFERLDIATRNLEAAQGDAEVSMSLPTPEVGTSQLTPEGGPSQPAPEVGTAQPAPEVGASQPPPEVGPSQPAPEVGTSQPAPEVGASQPPPEVGTSQPAPEVGTSQLAAEENISDANTEIDTSIATTEVDPSEAKTEAEEPSGTS